MGAVGALALLTMACTAEAQETMALAAATVPYEAPPASLLSARRAELIDSIGPGIVLLRSSSLRNLETEYLQDSDFRQDNDFLFLTGIEVPDSWLLIESPVAGDPSLTLFMPERDPGSEQWTGPRPSMEAAREITGIADVRPVGEFEEASEIAVSRARSAGLPVYSNAEAGSDIRTVVHQLRLTKDDFELRMLQRAIDITEAAHRAAMRTMLPGTYEYETEAVIEFNFRVGGAERVGFPSIVGSGPNSVILHYDRSRRRMTAGDLVVMDIGAEYDRYTTDITRSVPVSGTFTARQRAIYDLVLGSQQAGIDAVRPGATMGEVDRAARLYMRDHSGDLCGEQTCDAYFIHGIGHWLGMDVHDVGSYATPFESGMVLTVEPGIYLADENLGVRIEDDILVTETGSRLMSGSAPRDADEIEALMSRRIPLR